MGSSDFRTVRLSKNDILLNISKTNIRIIAIAPIRFETIKMIGNTQSIMEIKFFKVAANFLELFIGCILEYLNNDDIKNRIALNKNPSAQTLIRSIFSYCKGSTALTHEKHIAPQAANIANG